MRNETFRDHLESLYGTVERAFDLSPYLHRVDRSKGERPNAVIMTDGSLHYINRDGRLIRM